MPSLIPGFEYDIFISYRQKDNKYDGWVTEFVDNLKRELESTFKEDINVYFDTNPHDGLLETHDVDASLKEKLNCLIFIPVLSRTYCDPKSFAWEHEFRAFIERASQDQFGLKVKLLNGNVANRVLPVLIHDLDETDIKLCESTLGGVLRGVEFIYKSPGINRPLRSKEDKQQENLNQTIYRDQINKMALAIKELINGMKERSDQPVTDEAKGQTETKPKKHRLISVIGTIVILIAAIFVIYPFLFKKPEEKVVVAVMPFQNITKDTIWDYWQDGMQIGIISGLSGTEGLEIRSRESVSRNLAGNGITNYASITPSIARKTSIELRSNINIQGSILKTGSKVQVTAQINDSRKDAVLTSIQFVGPSDEAWILKIMDSLSLRIKNYLLISKLKKQMDPHSGGEFIITNSAEAFKYYINSLNSFSKSDFNGVINWCTKALEIDSNFVAPLNDITWAYMNLGIIDQAKKWCQRYYSRKDKMTMDQKNQAELTHLYLFGTFDERINFLKQMAEVDEAYHFLLGNNYLEIGKYGQAVDEYEKHLKVMAKMKIEDLWRVEYVNIGTAYHKAKLYKKEKELYKRAEKEFPDSPWVISRKASLSMITGDTAAANDYIRKYIKILKEKLVTDEQINSALVGIYNNGGNPDKAEAIFRHELLSKDPDNPELLNALAWFLIDNNRDINEGLKLVDRALEISPDNYAYIDTKGWGFYKQRKYQEALVLLEKSWELKPAYDHEVFTHLQEVKKAIALQK